MKTIVVSADGNKAREFFEHMEERKHELFARIKADRADKKEEWDLIYAELRRLNEAGGPPTIIRLNTKEKFDEFVAELKSRSLRPQ